MSHFDADEEMNLNFTYHPSSVNNNMPFKECFERFDIDPVKEEMKSELLLIFILKF